MFKFCNALRLILDITSLALEEWAEKKIDIQI